MLDLGRTIKFIIIIEKKSKKAKNPMNANKNVVNRIKNTFPENFTWITDKYHLKTQSNVNCKPNKFNLYATFPNL